ncbi:GPR1/FUN34/yaaH family-domain-containing protein [Mycena olivaceomarginata]|nr:GPR1/FUN34/yaaH family-domain-containing protein [Mycena olivaceomarginata]
MSTNEGPAHHSGIGNPGPLGSFAFASTLFVLSLYTVHTRGIKTPNVIVGMSLFTGGLTVFISGMWQFPRGNVFGGTIFASYGSFWMSYAMIFIPSTGILAAYNDNPAELSNALGIYLSAWVMLTFFFFLNVLRQSISQSFLLATLTIAFGCLAGAEFTQNATATKTGGALGIMGALIAYYIGLSELFASERRPFLRLPLGMLS